MERNEEISDDKIYKSIDINTYSKNDKNIDNFSLSNLKNEILTINNKEYIYYNNNYYLLAPPEVKRQSNLI